jgi:hypothetical protein
MVKLSVINHDRLKYDNIILQINPSLIVISDLVGEIYLNILVIQLSTIVNENDIPCCTVMNWL